MKGAEIDQFFRDVSCFPSKHQSGSHRCHHREHIRHVLASMHQMCFIGFRVNWLSPQGAFDDWGEKTNSDCVSEMAILKGINVTFWCKWNLF